MEKRLQDFQIFVKPASYRCNLNCSYCYYLAREDGTVPNTPPVMDDDLLEEYIRQHILAYPGETVNFSWHGGEPTLLGVEYFRKIVKLQQKHCLPRKRITNGIQTNGTLLDDEWCRFLAKHKFTVGLSLDGPAAIHDLYRCNRQGRGSHERAMRGYDCLVAQGIPVDILCVLNDNNVMYPLQVYQFFLSIGAKHVSFLPLVELLKSEPTPVVSERTVNPEAFGAFLCTIFDLWVAENIGTIKIQIFEEALRSAFHQDHSLCLFRPTCGDIPTLECDGNVYTCDHFIESAYLVGNIRDSSLGDLLDSAELKRFGNVKKVLPWKCTSCEVLGMCNGECPKNRFVAIAGEEQKLNYLCPGYKLFFHHCSPFVETVSQQWRRTQKQDEGKINTGRNEPCPCGSGRKYKRCCMKA